MPDASLDQCITALSDPDPQVRSRAAYDVRSHGADGLRAVPALLAMFDDVDRITACRAQFAVTDLGESVVPLLHRIRTSGPGRLRSAALTALAEIGGEAALSSRDAAAVERLIRVKLLSERPRPLSACWLHWIAVSGGDQEGIMRTLGLTDPRPVTFELGCDIVDGDAHGAPEDEPGSPLGRVFVTPELDGWTLVAGRWCDPCDAQRGEEILQRCLELSTRYGQAQAYYYGERNDGSAWLVAEDGVVVRRYKETGQAEDLQWTLGEPLDIERARRVELGLSPVWTEADDESEDEWKWAAFDLAPTIAAALSIDPTAIGSSTTTRGTPLIALTPFGVAEGVPNGAYRI